MSKVVRGVKKGVKKVGKAVRKNWKPIVGVGLAAFTGGLAIGGVGNFSAMLKSGAGFWTTVGSTMKAGITGVAGTFGLGSGASGAMAAGAFAGGTSMTGATLMTGAGAQALGLAAKGVGGSGVGAGVGTYTGPGSSFMGGGGSLFGGAAGAPPTAIAAQQGISSASLSGLGGPAATGYATGTAGSALAPAAAGGMGWKGMAAVAAVPALISAGGAYMLAKGEEEDLKQDVWGVSHENPQNFYTQNFASPYAGYFDPDGNSMGLMDVPVHARYSGGWV